MGLSTEGFFCRICREQTVGLGSVKGRFKPELFDLRHCPSCHYSFISNPWTNYEEIYCLDYYRGRGADPLVDYVFEFDHPDKAIRQYEWRGILAAVRSMVPIDANTNWLDFGCGTGAFCSYLPQHAGCLAVGHEEGGGAQAIGKGILSHKDLETMAGAFDVVSAIEVLEHTVDPLAVLREIRRLLKPGGLLFITTGNAQPFRNRLLQWSYVVPEVHVSFFEPQTLASALSQTGFRPEFRSYAGLADIIRFKVLKNLGIRRISVFERALPWSALCRLVEWRYCVGAHPVGWAV